MKEPWARDLNVPGDDFKPYSRCCVALLLACRVGPIRPNAELAADPFYNPEFRRAYAARLLRERGL